MSIEQQIVVRGEAERQAPADLAALSVLVQVDSAEQDDAFARAGAVATAVDVVLDQHAAALGPRQAAVVVVQPTTRWVDGEEQRTGWRAARSSTIDVTALDQVSPLLAALVQAGAVVHGPWWRLRPGHPALAEARAAAAADARARAESYAAGLDLRVGRVEWVSEPGLRPAGGGGEGATGVATRLAAKADAMGGAEIHVEPAELAVTASVEVAFAIER